MKQETIINRLETLITKEKEEYYDRLDLLTKLDELISELKLDTIDTYKVGRFNVNAYFKRFIKNVDSYRKPLYKNAHKQKNGKYGLCDGFIYIQFEDENDEIAQSLYKSEGDEYFLQYPISNCEMDKDIKIDMNYLEKLIGYNEVNKLKGNEQIPYIEKFDTDEYIGFNPQYLIGLLQLNNTNTITLGKTKVTPVEIKSEKYSCILCPVKIEANTKICNKALEVKQQLIKESE